MVRRGSPAWSLRGHTGRRDQRGGELEDMYQDSVKQSGSEQDETEREQAENCGKELMGAEQEGELDEESADMELDLEHRDEKWNPEAPKKQRTKNEFEIELFLRSQILKIFWRGMIVMIRNLAAKHLS